MRKPTSCSAVPGSLPSGSAHCATLLPFSLSFSSLPPLSSFLFFSFLFLHFSFPFLPFSSHFLLLLFSLPPPSPCCSPHELKLSSPCSTNIPCEALYIGFKRAMHVDTWHAMCHTHGLPCVTHMAYHVSHMLAFAMHCDTWLSMCHSHGLPCVTTWFSMSHPHGSPCVARHAFPRIREIPTISEFNKIQLGN